MEIIRGLVTRGVYYSLNFLALTVIGWFCLLVAFCPPHGGSSWSLEILYVLGASLMALVILKPAAFPNELRITPRKSDLFMVFLAIPFGGLCQYAAIKLIFGVAVCSWKVLLMGSPAMAVVVFLYYYLLSGSGLLFGGKRRVVLDLAPREKAALTSDFTAMQLDNYMEFLGRNDLTESLLKGDVSPIDLVIVSPRAVSNLEEDTALLRAHMAGVPIVDYREVSTMLSGRVRLADLDMWSFVTGSTAYAPLLRVFQGIKGLVEPILALMLGIVLAPLMVAVAAAIKITSPGPVFYRQVRTGFRGKPFVLIKFRSMRVDAEANGPQWASSEDPRVTPLGKFLRKTRLDEVPQLWNVVRGEMGFIGPRPERPEIYKKLKQEIPLFPMRTMIKPGITGWAQVCAGYAASVAESAIKLEYDLFYMQNLSPRLDLIIIFKTLQVAIFGDKSCRRPVDYPAQSIAEVS